MRRRRSSREKTRKRFQTSNSGAPDSSASAADVSPEFSTNQIAVIAASGTISDGIGAGCDASGGPPVSPKNACVARYIDSAGPHALKSSLTRL